MVYNAVKQMLITTTPLATGQRERHSALVGYLTGLQLGEAHGAQTGIAMKPQLACRAGLTIAQARELFGVAAQKFDLETRFVVDTHGLTPVALAKEVCIYLEGCMPSNSL